MSALKRFVRKPMIDQRLLMQAAALHALVTGALYLLPFRRVRDLAAALATFGPPPRAVERADARIVKAVRTVSSRIPGEHCLADALVAQCLLARHGCETTLCFGVARERAAGCSLRAHAWLEHPELGVVGARAVVHEPLRHPSVCVSSPPPR